MKMSETDFPPKEDHGQCGPGLLLTGTQRVAFQSISYGLMICSVTTLRGVPGFFAGFRKELPIGRCARAYINSLEFGNSKPAATAHAVRQPGRHGGLDLALPEGL